MQFSLDYHFSRAPVQGSFTSTKPKIGPRKWPVGRPQKEFLDAPNTKRRSIIAPNVRDNFPEYPNSSLFAIEIIFSGA